MNRFKLLLLVLILASATSLAGCSLISDMLGLSGDGAEVEASADEGEEAEEAGGDSVEAEGDEEEAESDEEEAESDGEEAEGDEEEKAEGDEKDDDVKIRDALNDLKQGRKN